MEPAPKTAKPGGGDLDVMLKYCFGTHPGYTEQGRDVVKPCPCVPCLSDTSLFLVPTVFVLLLYYAANTA